MEKQTTTNPKSIEDAIKALNSTTQQSASRIKSILDDDYSKITEILSNSSPEAKKALNELRDSSMAKMKESTQQAVKSVEKTAHDVNENVHQNPWLYIGGAAAITGLTGYILGRNKKRS